MLFVAVCLGLGIVYLAWAVRVFAASRLAGLMDTEHLRHASVVDASNARYHDLLARHLFYAEQDVSGALASYKTAVSIAPYAARSWLGLAEVLQVTGDTQGQLNAIQHAIAVDPRTPSIAWEAGNQFLIAGDRDAALTQFRTVFREDIQDVRIRPALEVSWRAAHDVGKLEAILPPNPAIWLDFITMLVDKKESDAAEKAWNDFISQHLSFDARQGLFYVDDLISQHDIARARHAWEQLIAADKTLQAYAGPGNMIVNGGFEHDLLDGGFDWRYVDIPGVGISLDAEDAHNGARSLQVLFVAATVPRAGVRQLIPVTPKTAYHFSAFVKGTEISSANGPRLAVYDSASHDMLFLSEEIQGTTPWHELSGRFVAGADTNLVTLDIVRTSSSTHINGKLWLDDVSLVPE